MKRLIIPK